MLLVLLLDQGFFFATTLRSVDAIQTNDLDRKSVVHSYANSKSSPSTSSAAVSFINLTLPNPKNDDVVTEAADDVP